MFISKSGIHHKGKKCDPSSQIEKAKKVYLENQQEFFASSLDLIGINTGIKRAKIPNGGWSDPRDHQLCKRFFSSSSSHHDSQNNIFNISDIVYI